MSRPSGRGYSRTLLLSSAMLGIIAISVILVSALQASSQGARLAIELPPGHEILNTSPQNVSLYYAELWAVVPDGFLVVKKGFLNPLRPVIEVTPADLINATSKWLEIYAKKGKHVKPSILIQVSAYSEKENRMALAFGASNDPRLSGLLRGKIPLLVAYLDPRSAVTGAGFAYRIENVQCTWYCARDISHRCIRKEISFWRQ